MASASVAVGAFLAAGTLSSRSGLAAGMTFLTCAGGYVLNDFLDVAGDRLIKPRRPLAAGLVAPGFALKYAIGLWVCAAVLAVLAGRVGLGFFAVWAAALWLYSSKLKGQGIYGHLVVSLVASSGFLLGAAGEGRVSAGWTPAGVAAVFHLTREVAKGVADAAGDTVVGVRTLAVRTGVGWGLRLVGWLVAACGLASLAPLVTRTSGLLYWPPVVATVLPLLVVALRMIIRARRGNGDPADVAGRVAAALKLAMVAGLVAFFLGGI